MGVHAIDALEAHLAAGSCSELMNRLAARAAADLGGAVELVNLARSSGGATATALMSRAIRRSPFEHLGDLAREAANADAAQPAHVLLDHGEVMGVSSDEMAFESGGALELFNQRFKDCLRRRGMPSKAAMLCAAGFKEMIDNAHEHAFARALPIAGYWVTDQKWTFVVSDTGRGMPEAMRANPNYARLSDHDAFLLALQPGVSSQHANGGYGFARVFKALVDRFCVLRFRTATVAAHWEGESPVEQQVELIDMPARPGLHLEISAKL